MEILGIVVIAVFGLASLGFFFATLRVGRDGISKTVVRAVGIVLVVVSAAVLAMIYESAVVAAVGLLGAVAGYLFGAGVSGGSTDSQANVGDVSGDNTKIAGRDLVEKALVDRMESLNTTIEQHSHSLASATGAARSGVHVHELKILAGDADARGSGQSGLVLAFGDVLRRFAQSGLGLISVSEGLQPPRSDYLHFYFYFAVPGAEAGEVHTTSETYDRPHGR